MSWMSFLFILFAITWAGVGAWRAFAIRRGLLDKPNNRSSHTIPTPRGGGIICLTVWSCLLLIFYYINFLSLFELTLFVPATLAGCLGFVDDLKGLSAKVRFVGQCSLAFAILIILSNLPHYFSSVFGLPSILSALVLVLLIVWLINVFNFMDGTDGLAAVQGLFIFAIGGYFLYQHQAVTLSVLAWAYCAILGGFLAWNWPPAKIFMGDSGSCFLGCLTATMALAGFSIYQLSLIPWIILTAPFWFDASVTLLRRIMAKEQWTKPHRRHAYQRMIQYGWGHQKLLTFAILVNCMTGGIAFWTYGEPRLEWFGVGLTLVLLTSIYLLTEVAKPMYKTWYKF